MQDSSWKSLSLQPSVAQLEQIFEFSSHLVFIYNWDLKKLIFVNNRVAEKLGYTPEDIQQMEGSILTFVEHPDKEGFLKEIHAEYESLEVGKKVEFVCKLLHKNGSIRTLRNRSMLLARDSPEASR
jgi:PAS domain S-box-containing protein